MNVTLLAITPDPEKVIETAGRVCYRSEPGDTARFISNRMREGHLSIFEHASATFLIEGISRACSHQLVRHRLCSFSQESQRYVELGNSGHLEYVVPDNILMDEEAYEVVVGVIDHAELAYKNLRALGIKKEDARFMFPNATTTRLVMTANFRQWLHIFDQRISQHAQWEIRNVCLDILSILYQEAENVFKDAYTSKYILW